MKFILPILAILVCAAAAYFTLTQSEKFQNVQKQRLEAISTNEKVSANTDAVLVKIEEEKARLAEAQDKLLVATSSVSNLKSVNNSIQNEVNDLDASLVSLEEQFAALQKTLEEAKKEFAALGGDINIDNIGIKVTEFEASIEGKRTKIEELDTLAEAAEKSITERRDEIKRMNDKIAASNRRIALNAMEARVSAVNQDWGFVVIGAGSNSGFNPDTRLLVKRDGRLVGSVRPSSIEPTQTIAEIDMKSLSPGVRIQPGDKVMLASPAKK